MDRLIRVAFAIGGVMAAVLATGYFLQSPWASASWPWVDGRLSNIFVSSVLAAIAVPLLWIGYSGHFGGATGGFLQLGGTLGGTAGVLLPLAGELGDDRFYFYGSGATVAAIVCVALALWAHRQPTRDERALTTPMRIWFALYIVILIPPGIALLKLSPYIMPWPLKPESSLIYGCVFLAAICSFAYPLLRPKLEYAYVGLWGFLAYDLVLIPPFLAHFRTVKPELTTTLSLYVTALIGTAIVSVWYLFVNRATRIGARATP